MHIIPAILPKDFSEILAKLELVRGVVGTVQIDIADGKFVPNKTWPFLGTRINPSSRAELTTGRGADESGYKISDYQRNYLRVSADLVDFEFDLMVASPREVVPDFVRVGASRVILHIESAEADTLSDIISEWKHAVDIGLALKPSTPIDRLEYFLHEISFVQCMGNDRVGFQGVVLDEAKVLPKISLLRKKYPELIISVDIGVNSKTAPRLISAGANRLVVGSAIFSAPNPRAAIEELKRVV